MTIQPLFRAAALAIVWFGFAAPVLAGPKEDILAAHEAMVAKGKFRTAGVSESKGSTTRIENTVVWPDRYAMRADTDGTVMEYIILPGSTWMKQGGEWMKLPMDMSRMIQSLTPEAMRQAYEGMTNVEQLADDDVDGRDAKVYRYDSQVTMMGITASSKVTLWVDADTGLPLKQEVDGEAMRTKSHTVQTYTFDDSIQISAPR